MTNKFDLFEKDMIYVPVIKNVAGVTDLQVNFYYDKGGMNPFTCRDEPRGYYLSVKPVKRDGIMISYVAFSGARYCIKRVGRKGKNAELEARKSALDRLPKLIYVVCEKNDLVVLETAE